MTTALRGFGRLKQLSCSVENYISVMTTIIYGAIKSSHLDIESKNQRTAGFGLQNLLPPFPSFHIKFRPFARASLSFLNIRSLYMFYRCFFLKEGG